MYKRLHYILLLLCVFTITGCQFKHEEYVDFSNIEAAQGLKFKVIGQYETDLSRGLPANCYLPDGTPANTTATIETDDTENKASGIAPRKTSSTTATNVVQQLLKYGGDLAIGAYGIVNRINFMFVMIVMGFNQGMQPIAGYNYGARQYSRVKKTFTLTVLWATGICLFWFASSEVFPSFMVGIFTNDPELTSIADRGLRIMNPVVPIVGWQMVSTNLFQSLGMIKKSIFLSLSRQLLFLVPLVYGLPLLLDVDGVFLAFPCSDILACIATIILIHNLFRKFSKLKDGDEPSILGSAIS